MARNSLYVKYVRIKGYEYAYLRPPPHLRARGLSSVRLVSDDPVAEAAELIERAHDTQDFNLKFFQKHVRMIYRKAARRAIERKIPFSISAEDVASALARSKLRCEVTNIPFRMEVATNSYRQPFRPSLDRIDAQRGYEPSNIRMVCVAVNMAMADWGEDVFWSIVEAARKRGRRRTVEKTPETISANEEN